VPAAVFTISNDLPPDTLDRAISNPNTSEKAKEQAQKKLDAVE
jgi:hypothetical protein